MKRLLITGINGMLGNALHKVFSKEFEIAGIHRDKKCLSNVSKDYSIDLSLKKELSSVILDFRPDIIIHCAGIIDMEKCERDKHLANVNNVLATRNIVEVCPEKCLFIYISTDQVYGDAEGKREDNKNLFPLNEYGKSKLLGEREIIKRMDRYIIARTNIFGWNIKKNKLSSAEWIYKKLIIKENINLFSDYYYSPIYTINFAENLLDLIRKKFVGIINISALNSCSKYEFGLEMCRKMNLDPNIITKYSILDHKFLAKRNLNISLDISKLKSLGVPTTTWIESLDAFLCTKGIFDNINNY